MSRLLTGLAAVTLGLVPVACAPAPGTSMAAAGGTAGTSACFYADEAIRFRPGETQSVYVRANGSDIFQLTATGYCRDMDSVSAIGFTATPGPARRLCVGDTTQVSLSAAVNPTAPCRVQVTRRLTPEQAAALPDRYRP
tara:strand:- start:54 stop:470 length:417 start_codon:yes stop_codon:yes gene_type:complete